MFLCVLIFLQPIVNEDRDSPESVRAHSDDEDEAYSSSPIDCGTKPILRSKRKLSSSKVGVPSALLKRRKKKNKRKSCAELRYEKMSKDLLTLAARTRSDLIQREMSYADE